MKEIGRLACGTLVMRRKKNFMQPGIEEALLELLEKINAEGREFITDVVDLGRTIGKDVCVWTDPTDLIFYAIREGHRGHSRFAIRRDSSLSTRAVVILRWSEVHSNYVLITAYFGNKRPREPWDERAIADSTWFWKNHAFVDDRTYKIVASSRTKECPW